MFSRGYGNEHIGNGGSMGFGMWSGGRGEAISGRVLEVVVGVSKNVDDSF